MESERLLSIQEVAQRLHLQYRTVYRLVISGQIPGAKIGGVYRVRPGDLEKYIEAQKSRTTLEAPVCARCGAPFLTASPPPLAAP